MRRSKPRRLKCASPFRFIGSAAAAAAAAVMLFALSRGLASGLFSSPGSLVEAALGSTALGSTVREPAYGGKDSSDASEASALAEISASPPTSGPSPSLSVPTAEVSAPPTASPLPVDLDPLIRTITVTPSESDESECADGVYVKNETKYDINVRSCLESEIDESLLASPQHIIIVHTHASEAFYPDGDDIYTPTDVQRTEDARYNVIRLGDALAEILTSNGYVVTHIRDVFDYPSYSGSYTRTLSALEAALGGDPGVCVIIDIHRDAITSADGSSYRLISDTSRGRAAQMMLVVGTDESGLAHSRWKTNLVFAAHLQKHIIDEYPTLMRPIALSRSRYNQHLTHGSVIVEVGAAGNTLDEALLSITLFGEELSGFFADISG